MRHGGWTSLADVPATPEEGVDLCQFCGEPSFLDVLEVFPADRALEIESCCEWSHELWLDEMRDGWDRKVWREFFQERTGIDIRQVDTGHTKSGSWTLDWGLELRDVDQTTAKDFVRTHHRHNPPPAGWRWGHGIYNGPDLIGVAMVGRPVARALDHTTIVEVNRLCVRADLDASLVWNACSQLYGAAVAEAEARGFLRVVTYTLESEEAGTLKAAGFTVEATTKGGSWNTPSRPRADHAPTCKKVRWSRVTRAGEQAERKARSDARRAERLLAGVA